MCLTKLKQFPNFSSFQRLSFKDVREYFEPGSTMVALDFLLLPAKLEMYAFVLESIMRNSDQCDQPRALKSPVIKELYPVSFY